ncbi:MAG: outer membrane lipoprotein-sorting protein [Candidatus Eisenbacteria bacterium]|nr:outer membrane lipoprotein-sorting protein [Candidatus Eisenbacteria bacterium]
MSRSLMLKCVHPGWCFLGATLALAACAGAETGPAFRQILKKVDAYRGPSQQFTVHLKLTSVEGGTVVETALFDVYVGGKDRSLAIARKYRTRDMKILYVGENMWVHLPNSRRPIRITPIQRLMGEASNGDVLEVSYSQNYMVRRADKDTILGMPCLKLDLDARSTSASYKRIVLWVRQDDCRPVCGEFYLVSGKRLKTVRFEEFAEIDGKQILTRMTIHDEVKKQSRTTFEYLNVTPRFLPAKYFNKDYLMHVRGL